MKLETVIGEPELGFVGALAEKAGELILNIAKEGFERSRKEDRSIVTTADLAANELIVEALKERFPGDAIISEEAGLYGDPTSSRVWIVDPLDGTKAFARGKPGYCVMIGLLIDHFPAVGAVYAPESKVLWYAKRGYGCYRVGPGDFIPQPCSIQARRPSGPYRLATTPGLSRDARRVLESSSVLEIIPTLRSVGLKVGTLVEGLADSYFSLHGLSYWDSVAPLAIALEAGARCSLVNGEPILYDISLPAHEWTHQTPIIVSAPKAHEEVRLSLEAIGSFD